MCVSAASCLLDSLFLSKPGRGGGGNYVKNLLSQSWFAELLIDLELGLVEKG